MSGLITGQRRPLRSVLLVEDDPHITRLAILSLKNFGGMNVTSCKTGTEAITLAKQEPPDLILLDVMIPELDGVATLRQLRADPDLELIPVVFLTARAQPKEVSEYLEMGALDVIRKPFDPLELPGRLRRIWSGLKEEGSRPPTLSP